MKYELVSLSVFIAGKVFRKDDKPVLDDGKLPKAELEAAYAAGFIKPKGTSAKTVEDVLKQHGKEQQKEQEKADEKIAENNTKIAEDKAAEVAKEKLANDKKESKK